MRLQIYVLRKIKDIKQYTVDEGKKVNESLKAYQERYDRQMSDLHNELHTKFTNEKQHQTDEYKRGYDRMQHLEDLL